MASKRTSKENKTSPAKIAANKRYNDENTEILQCRVKKDERINERVNEGIEAIRAATGNKNYTKGQFILDAIRAKLDGPQPVQVPQPQPDTTPATIPDGMELLHVLLSSATIRNLDGAIDHGYGIDRDTYIAKAVNAQVKQDIATENEKRRARAAQRAQYKLSDDFFTGDPADNPPPFL